MVEFVAQAIGFGMAFGFLLEGIGQLSDTFFKFARGLLSER
jgi:hypothetical protein